MCIGLSISFIRCISVNVVTFYKVYQLDLKCNKR